MKDKMTAAGDVPAYRNPTLSPERRVKELLALMSVEEKAAQMTCVWQKKKDAFLDDDGGFDAKKAARSFGHGNGIGQVGRPGDAGAVPTEPWKGRTARQQAELTNSIQRFFIEKSRLGIPVIFHEECLHGLAEKGATSFPQPIGLAATFDTDLVEELYTMTAEEARVRGTHQALTPVVDVARDPRWGRVEETFGEDPYLVTQMGIAAVRGFQGDASFKGKRRVIATLKHFAAHGQPESGMNCAPVNVSERVLRETFLSTFKAVIDQAGAISVMASYNEIDGVPSHASRWLLRDVLRREWGWKGFIVSDYYAIWELAHRPDTHGHHIARDKREACVLAVKAGVNIELPEPDCYLHLVDLVKQGTLKESELDDMVAPMLLWKFKLGLFDDPYVDPDEAERVSGSKENRKIARKAASEVITLLKNEKALLPLKIKKLKSIAVIGPNSNRSLLGGYSGIPNFDVTVLEGIKAKVGGKVKVMHGEGCGITKGGSWTIDEVVPADARGDKRLIKEAVRIAKKADVVVLALGGNEQTSREAWGLNHMGDRTGLDLIGRQDELVKAILATGKPVVVLLFHGRPNSINFIAENVPAILECWYLGQECGHAVADVLFGDVNPAGKLPITVPRSAGHLPTFYNYKPSARRGFLFDDVSPLFAFGYGLSYTRFSIDNIRLSKKRMKRDGSVSVSVDIANIGKRGGSEVVQMYVRDLVSSVTRPVKELKGFRKVFLEAGEKQTVRMEITPESLAFYDIDMNYTVEPGDFEIMVGNSSRDEDLRKVVLTVG